MSGGYMNPKYAELMGHGDENTQRQSEGSKAKHEEHQRKGYQHLPPHMSIHTHAAGHEVHITHGDGTHEHHHHELNDSEGLKAHIDRHFSGGKGSAPEGHESADLGSEPMLAGER
jgi:hypothetical protein